MALDIGVADPGTRDLRSAPRAYFRSSEGYYWFLYPLIEQLGNTHGKHIDLYADVEFRVGELSVLREFLDNAQALVESQPTNWKVHVGTQFSGETKRELYAEVSRIEFVQLLAQLRSIAAAAEEDGSSVVFTGD